MQLLRNAAAHGAGVGSNFRPIQTVYKRSVRTNIQFTNLKVGSISFVQNLCSFSQSILNLKKFHLFKNQLIWFFFIGPTKPLTASYSLLILLMILLVLFIPKTSHRKR